MWGLTGEGGAAMGGALRNAWKVSERSLGGFGLIILHITLQYPHPPLSPVVSPSSDSQADKQDSPPVKHCLVLSYKKKPLNELCVTMDKPMTTEG